jgi:hypothetical protein
MAGLEVATGSNDKGSGRSHISHGEYPYVEEAAPSVLEIQWLPLWNDKVGSVGRVDNVWESD